MAVGTPFKLDVITLPGGGVINELEDERLEAGIQSLITHPAGHVHPMYRANDVVQPAVDFTTPDLATLLGEVGTGGTGFTDALTCYLKKSTQTGAVARTTLGHHSIAISEGLIYWDSITLPHRGQGKAQVKVLAGFDGSNDPFAFASAVALPGNLSDGNYYGAGPVSINGTAVSGIQEIQIDCGAQIQRAGGASEEFDTFLWVQETKPIVTIRALDPVNWGTILLRGTDLDGTSGLEFYGLALRKSNASTDHIKGQATNGAALPVDSSGQGTGLITDTLRVECIAASDSVNPLVFSTGVAIP